MEKDKGNRHELNNTAADLAENGKFAEAESILRQAAEKYPRDKTICFNLGLTLLKRGDKEESLIWFDSAVASAGNGKEKGKTAIECALALSEAGMYGKMNYFLEEAEKTEPENPVYWNLKGIAAFVSRDYNRALIFFENAVSIDSSYADAWFNLRDTYSELGLEKDAGNAEKIFLELTEFKDHH